MQSAIICIHRMWIWCTKSVECGCECGCVASYYGYLTAIQLSYLKLNSYKQTSSE